MVSTYKDDNGEDYEQWAARKLREMDERKAQAGLEARLAALARRTDKRLEEIVKAVELAFGDLRTEMQVQRTLYDDEAQRLADLRDTHEVRVERLIRKAVKDEARAFGNEIQKLRNSLHFLEARVKELEARAAK
ncbi:polyhydroxyalkanoate synthesis regulator phasin [Sinorhizobium fredii]|uniref:Uncharacterized protein n=1 Tax=Sinorhizobium fredii (strain USDA 257) TaxID=1185652 RepID=I3XAH6_SINF2|nr:hypothetical protein [Sinorhizobium fredii]AFL52882.1 hypothetical protein USDA257_c43430 [Sinorhizobium fredii USDA 257]